MFINFYAPNTEREHVVNLQCLSDMLSELDIEPEREIIWGGDFNMTVDIKLDRMGGNPSIWKNSSNILSDVCSKLDLIDIWRIRNPLTKRFTWRRLRPELIQSRIDYFLTSSSLQQAVIDADVVSCVYSDHSAITLCIGDNRGNLGRSYWKLNNSFLLEDDYTNYIYSNLNSWVNDCNSEDPIQIWEFLKYKIKGASISYGKKKARDRKDSIKALETQLNTLEAMLASNPCENTKGKMEVTRKELLSELDYITEGSIIRSRANWYGLGEKNTKYFLGLEKANAKKSQITQVINRDGLRITHFNDILSEIKTFYSRLYSSNQNDGVQIDDFIGSVDMPRLSDVDKDSCDGLISNTEALNSLKSMPKNKTPGNDGLSVEFYIKFWPLLGPFVINALNASYGKGELSNSQRQGVITLIEKQGKDKRYIKNWRPITLLNVDYKIGAKCIAKRLERVLPKIISVSQSAFVKGRQIGDCIRIIEGIMEYTKSNDLPGILVAIDFEKAFDSLEWSYVFKCLNAFNFGPSLLKWICTFYSNPNKFQ